MQQFKQNIAAVLLAFFLFPQIASSIHYYVVPHEIITRHSYEFGQTKPDLRFHSCLFHVSAMSMVLPPEDFPELNRILVLCAKTNFKHSENYIPQTEIHFQLRGPPVV